MTKNGQKMVKNFRNCPEMSKQWPKNGQNIAKNGYLMSQKWPKTAKQYPEMSKKILMFQLMSENGKKMTRQGPKLS